MSRWSSFWNPTGIGIVLAILGIAATLGTVMWLEYRQRLQKDIDLLLRECRETENWDDKSESKLIQWMLDTSEDQLHQCGLLRLRRIRESMRDYLYIHLYGRDPAPLAGPLESLLQAWADRLRCRRQNRVQQPRRSPKRRSKRQ